MHILQQRDNLKIQGLFLFVLIVFYEAAHLWPLSGTICNAVLMLGI